MGFLPKVARIAPHLWEEPCISGANGTGAVFFSGCTLACVYCQNYEISHNGKGVYITPRRLALEYKRLEALGVHSISLISASHFLDGVIESLDIYKPKIPVVYNCGGYESVNAIKRLDGYVDIFLPDFKYADNSLAAKYSKAPDYCETALAAIEQMYAQTGNARYDGDGLMLSGVLIRHLVLPNHTKNSIDALRLIHSRFGTQLKVSLMGQYFPNAYAARFEKLGRRITRREYEKVVNVMLELGLDGFCQELSSADKAYVPEWDFSNGD